MGMRGYPWRSLDTRHGPDRLERRGVIRRGTGKPSPPGLTSRPAVGADVVAALLRERDEGP